MRLIGLAVVLALSLALAPLAAEAADGKGLADGFISVTHTKVEDSFFQQLRELGYVEGQNLLVERRYSEGRAERFAEFATAFVRQNLDMIVVTTTPAGLAARNATKTIPIVQPNSIDPVGAGLVASLARPGGNFTGTTQQAPELVPKRLQLLVEMLPRVSRVDVIWNAATLDTRGSISTSSCNRFGASFRRLLRRAREVSAGPREASDEAGAYGIDSVRLDDQNCLGRVSGGKPGWCRGNDDHVEVLAPNAVANSANRSAHPPSTGVPPADSVPPRTRVPASNC